MSPGSEGTTEQLSFGLGLVSAIYSGPAPTFSYIVFAAGTPGLFSRQHKLGLSINDFRERHSLNRMADVDVVSHTGSLSQGHYQAQHDAQDDVASLTNNRHEQGNYSMLNLPI